MLGIIINHYNRRDIMIKVKKLPDNVYYDYRDIFGAAHYHNKRFYYVVSPHSVITRYLIKKNE